METNKQTIEQETRNANEEKAKIFNAVLEEVCDAEQFIEKNCKGDFKNSLLRLYFVSRICGKPHAESMSIMQVVGSLQGAWYDFAVVNIRYTGKSNENCNGFAADVFTF